MPSQDFSKRRIFKYELAIKPRQVIMMPKGATVLSIDRQGPLPYIWASVDQSQPFEPRVFRVVTTGEVFNEERLMYVGHVKLGGKPEPWYEAFVYEVDTTVEQINPDPIEERFQGDLAEARREVTEAVAYEELVAA